MFCSLQHKGLIYAYGCIVIHLDLTVPLNDHVCSHVALTRWNLFPGYLPVPKMQLFMLISLLHCNKIEENKCKICMSSKERNNFWRGYWKILTMSWEENCSRHWSIFNSLRKTQDCAAPLRASKGSMEYWDYEMFEKPHFCAALRLKLLRDSIEVYITCIFKWWVNF